MYGSPLQPDPQRLSATQKWMALATGILVLALFFRQHLLNHFTVLSGDRYDAVIVAALLEHWFNVLQGLAQWNSPNYFFPYAKTLSYNDGYFLYGVIYSVFRAAALDPFLSSELVNVTVKAIGFASFFVAARRMLALPFAWALLGAVIFTLSNNSYIQIMHAQLLAVAFVPLAGLLIHETVLALLAGNRRELLLKGTLAGALFAALLMTSAYTAWFFALFVTLTMLVQLALLRGEAAARLRSALARHYGPLLLIAAAGALCLAPFASAYLFGHHGKRSWGELLVHSPSVLDSINTGHGNLLFGELFGWLREHCAACDIGTGERETGVGPGLLLVAAAGIVALATRRLRGSALLLGLALASALTWLLAVRVGPLTGWYLVYKFWPGGNGLRVVSRIFIVLSVPLIGLAMWYLAQKAQHWGKTVVLLLCALLVAEQWNSRGTVGVHRATLLARTMAVPAAPAACRAFYTGMSPDSDPNPKADFVFTSMAHNIDAMVIAELIKLPTINGHASFTPDDWNFALPANADYESRVQQYAAAHSITGLCRLDLLNLTWSAPAAASDAAPAQRQFDLALAAPGPGLLLEGFDAAEPFGRWSLGQRATIHYTLRAGTPRPTSLRLTLASVLVNAQHSQLVQISVNQGPQQAYTFASAGQQVLDLALPDDKQAVIRIDFDLPRAVTPRELGINDDTRQLAIGLKSLEFR